MREIFINEEKSTFILFSQKRAYVFKKKFGSRIFKLKFFRINLEKRQSLRQSIFETALNKNPEILNFFFFLHIQKTFQPRRSKRIVIVFCGNLARKTLISHFNRQLDRNGRAVAFPTSDVYHSVVVADDLIND